MGNVLKTNNICKKYKNKLVLDKVNMNIDKGDIYGFVGENGSGKTTIIRIITGLIFPNSGSFKLYGVDNNDPKILKEKQKMSAVVETPSIYRNLSAKDNLKMQCKILGVKDDEETIKKALCDVGLGELYDNKKVAGNFSLGMRQRLGIAMALLSKPEFMVLDEPMNGLDPAGIIEVRELILKLNKENNITFLISSHILTELALVATKYGIISKGKLIREITNEQLQKECRNCIEMLVDDVSLAKDVLIKVVLENDIEIINDKIKIYGEYELNEILKQLIKNKVVIKSVNCISTNIEDYYMKLLGGRHNA